MLKILHVVGARPNFMKVAPLVREMASQPEIFTQVLVHTGQHYDDSMSKVFFDDLDLPRPDVNLSVGSGTHAVQTAEVMMRFEPVVLAYRPDWVVVPGDVNSTIACALVASKLHIPVAHIEAGLRSFDRSMPEEINRLLTDQLSGLLFTTSPDADENLRREGVDERKIRLVGNLAIDTLARLLPKAEQGWPALAQRLGLSRYILATLHRPSNVDDPARLAEILKAFTAIGRDMPIVFPVHPRTRQRIQELRFQEDGCGLRLIEPQGYLNFLALEAHAALVLTDSGGVQAETAYLRTPCITVRRNTEWTVTLSSGANRLVDCDAPAIVAAVRASLEPPAMAAAPPDLWDGRAAARVREIMAELA